MSNIFTDKYFTKARIVAEHCDMNPIVSYRIFGRFEGVAALEPMKRLFDALTPDDCHMDILPTGTPFGPKDTIAIYSGPFQSLVEHETLLLQWAGLPCYCAKTARDISEASHVGVMDFAARHLFGSESVALASYGARVGGIEKFSTDVGANSEEWLSEIVGTYKRFISGTERTFTEFLERGVGTTPHALIAIFRGDYAELAQAYTEALPDDKYVALIDYNNREIDDSVISFKAVGEKLYGVRLDTCGENYSQRKANAERGTMSFEEIKTGRGIVLESVSSLRKGLDVAGAKEVRILLSSGFNLEKTKKFVKGVYYDFDGIGTGSFLPYKQPTCTADIFEVDGEEECKVGRDWGIHKNAEFYEVLNSIQIKQGKIKW